MTAHFLRELQVVPKCWETGFMKEVDEGAMVEEKLGNDSNSQG